MTPYLLESQRLGYILVSWMQKSVVAFLGSACIGLIVQGVDREGVLERT